jgi:hypothetical protein
LQAFDLRTDRGLAQTEALSRFRQAPGLGNGNDGSNNLDWNIDVLVSPVHQGLPPKLT